MRRSLAGLILGVLAILAFGTAAQGADRSAENRTGVVTHSVHSRPHLRAFWNPARIRRAQPLSVLRVSGGRVRREAGAAPVAAGGTQGIDTGDPTVYPNSANGIVLFFYGPDEFQCSGSVIDTAAGNVVLTAGHCVIDPGPGTQATDIIFIPGYRDGAEPFGEWPATSSATPAVWQNTTSTGDPNDADEAGDMGMLTLANRPSDSATVQSVVGAVGIAFNQSRSQTYMEYGYPGESPYEGGRLCELTSPLGASDFAFSPATMGIVSDFTPGSSGGPWLVGNAPVAMSVSDYRYISGPATAYMFGPYFGSIAQNLFVSVGGSGSGSAATGTIPATGATPCVPQATSNAAVPQSSPSNAFTIEFLTRDRSRGVAVFGVKVPGAGVLVLRGAGLRRATKFPEGAGIVKLRVHAKGSALDELRHEGSLRARARIVYTPTGGSTNTKSRGLTLIRRP